MKLPAKLLAETPIDTGKLAVFCKSVMLALRVEEAVRRSNTKASHGCAVVDRKTVYWCLANKVTDTSIYQSATFQPSLL